MDNKDQENENNHPHKVCEETFVKKSSIFNSFWTAVGVAFILIGASVAWAIAVSVDISNIKRTQIEQGKQIDQLVKVFNDIDTVKTLLKDENRKMTIAKLVRGQ